MASKFPYKCIWVSGFLGVWRIPGHVHPALHLLRVVATITSKAKVGGAGGRVEPTLPEQQNRPISNVTLGRGPLPNRGSGPLCFLLGLSQAG